MPRLKLKRFRVQEPPPAVQAQYIWFYSGRDLYFNAEQLPQITSQALFGVEAPMVFDLGCGRGEFLVKQAALRPDTLFVGLEWHLKSVWDATNRAFAAGLENVRFVKADLRLALAIVPEESVSEAFMLFPPPKLKPRKKKQDMLQASTLRHIHRVLVPGGLFHFVTDHPVYFSLKRELIEASGLFDITSESQAIEGGLTRFQKFWEGFDIESRRLECRKK